MEKFIFDKGLRDTGCWPTPQQELLLKATIVKGKEAVDAWTEWRKTTDLDRIDHESQMLLPMLYRNLSLMGIRDPVMNTYKGVLKKTWVKNQVILNEISGLLRTLQDAGIPTMLLKGAAMTLLYYKDPGLRAMADIDILVPTIQTRHAIDILSGLGWKPRKDSGALFNEKYPALNKANQFADHRGYQVDLHWHLLHECCYSGGDDDFWSASIPVRVTDTLTVQALNPTDQLFHLVVHAMRWNPTPLLRWATDVMMILDHGHEIDWNRLISQAEKRELILPIRNGLTYLSELFNAPIPQNVLNEIQMKPVSAFEYRDFRSQNHATRLLGGLIITWYLYCRLDRKKSLLRRLPGFARYLQFAVGAKHLWQLPFYIIYFGIRRIRTYLVS